MPGQYVPTQCGSGADQAPLSLHRMYGAPRRVWPSAHEYAITVPVG